MSLPAGSSILGPADEDGAPESGAAISRDSTSACFSDGATSSSPLVGGSPDFEASTMAEVDIEDGPAVGAGCGSSSLLKH